MSKSWAELEQRLQQQGYKMQQGKGLTFLDEKGVCIKGAEVGYYLATLERMLQQQQLKQQQQIQQLQQQERQQHHMRHHL